MNNVDDVDAKHVLRDVNERAAWEPHRDRRLLTFQWCGLKEVEQNEHRRMRLMAERVDAATTKVSKSRKENKEEIV